MVRSRMWWALLLGVLLVGAPGCRKKSARQFYDLESRYTVAVAREGDEAYGSGEMDEVVTGLRAVPEDAIEGPKAKALLATITTERARLAREREEAARANVPTPPPQARPSSVFATPSSADAVDAGSDAGQGPSDPVGGMLVEDFIKAFGKCMLEGPVPEGGFAKDARAFAVLDSEECRKKHHVEENGKIVFIFEKGRLTTRRMEKTTTTVVDAGQRVVPITRDETSPAPYVMGMPRDFVDDAGTAQ